METFIIIILSIFSYIAGIFEGINYWRSNKYCRHCGKFYDQPVSDPTDWRNDAEKNKHFE